MKIVNTARAIIVHEGKLLVFKLRREDNWWCLPGGKIEAGEQIEAAMRRELIEETGIEPVIGKLLVIQDLIMNDEQRIEFFFEIKNSADYLNIDFSNTTHGFEVSECKFWDPKDETMNVLPRSLKTIVGEINNSGTENFRTRLMVGDKE